MGPRPYIHPARAFLIGALAMLTIFYVFAYAHAADTRVRPGRGYTVPACSGATVCTLPAVP